MVAAGAPSSEKFRGAKDGDTADWELGEKTTCECAQVLVDCLCAQVLVDCLVLRGGEQTRRMMRADEVSLYLLRIDDAMEGLGASRLVRMLRSSWPE